MNQKTNPIPAGRSSAENTTTADSFTEPAPGKPSYILVVTRNGHMTEPVMDYAVNVADRLKYRILAVHINTLPFYRDGGRRSGLFASAMQDSALIFREKAAKRGLHVEHIGDAGKIGNIVSRLCHSEKHIEFVVIDQGIRKEEVASRASVPVFSVIYTPAKAGRISSATHHKPLTQGVSPMSTISRKRHLKNCFVFGALTAGVYAAVFLNQELVMTYFTRGGVYALLPVAVVFAISYAHGNFTSSFWSALGIEGSKVAATRQADIRKDAADRPEVRKDTRPRAQVSV